MLVSSQTRPSGDARPRFAPVYTRSDPAARETTESVSAATAGDSGRTCQGILDGVPGDLHVRGSVVIPEAELRWRFSRSSGPGGQGVNTTDSRVELSYDLRGSSALGPTLRARALRASRRPRWSTVSSPSPRRSTARSCATARPPSSGWSRRWSRRLAPPPRPRRPTRPTKASVERRVASKKRRAEVKRLRRGDRSSRVRRLCRAGGLPRRGRRLRRPAGRTSAAPAQLVAERPQQQRQRGTHGEDHDQPQPAGAHGVVVEHLRGDQLRGTGHGRSLGPAVGGLGGSDSTDSTDSLDSTDAGEQVVLGQRRTSTAGPGELVVLGRPGLPLQRRAASTNHRPLGSTWVACARSAASRIGEVVGALDPRGEPRRRPPACPPTRSSHSVNGDSMPAATARPRAAPRARALWNVRW